MIAAVCNSRFSDNYYGQWLLLRIPFRSVDELWREEALLVPETYRMFALCLLHDATFWRDLGRVRQDLELEAYKDPVIESNLAMVRAHTDIVNDYLNGNLVLGEDPIPPRHLHTPFGGGRWVGVHCQQVDEAAHAVLVDGAHFSRCRPCPPQPRRVARRRHRL